MGACTEAPRSPVADQSLVVPAGATSRHVRNEYPHMVDMAVVANPSLTTSPMCCGLERPALAVPGRGWWRQHRAEQTSRSPRMRRIGAVRQRARAARPTTPILSTRRSKRLRRPYPLLAEHERMVRGDAFARGAGQLGMGPRQERRLVLRDAKTCWCPVVHWWKRQLLLGAPAGSRTLWCGAEGPISGSWVPRDTDGEHGNVVVIVGGS